MPLYSSRCRQRSTLDVSPRMSDTTAPQGWSIASALSMTCRSMRQIRVCGSILSSTGREARTRSNTSAGSQICGSTTRNVFHLMRGGRARWKIENETFNTLKNQGYNFAHTYGHGEQHLSVVFAILMMLAFLVDQAPQLCCALFRAVWAEAREQAPAVGADARLVLYLCLNVHAPAVRSPLVRFQEVEPPRSAGFLVIALHVCCDRVPSHQGAPIMGAIVPP